MGGAILIIVAIGGVLLILIKGGGDILQGEMSGDPAQIAQGLIKGFESCRLTAYPDPPGQSITYSIGWGHQITGADGLDASSSISQETADSLLADDLGIAQNCVEGSVTVSLTPTQEAALISFVYNEGCAHFQGSTLLSKLNSGDATGAAAEFGRWIYAGGAVSAALVSRRAQEMQVFNT